MSLNSSWINVHKWVLKFISPSVPLFNINMYMHFNVSKQKDYSKAIHAKETIKGGIKTWCKADNINGYICETSTSILVKVIMCNTWFGRFSGEKTVLWDMWKWHEVYFDYFVPALNFIRHCCAIKLLHMEQMK